MTAYEIISIFLGVLSLLIAFGSLLIRLLPFLIGRTRGNKNAYPVCQQDRQLSLRAK